MTPQQPQPVVPPRTFPPSRAVTPQSQPSPLGSSPIKASPSSIIGSTRSQPSSVCTTASHGYSTYSILACRAPKFMPQFVRSVTDRATPVHEDHSMKNVTRAPSDSAFPSDDARWALSNSAFPSRSPAPPLPLDFQPPQPPPLPHANSEMHRHVASSCLSTPAWFGTHTSATSRLLRSALLFSSGLPGSWGTNSLLPTSRVPSAIESTADRLVRPLTSEDGVLEGQPTARKLLGYISCNRNHGHSISGRNSERVASPRRPMMEWLGLHTAKAFATAGVLDYNVNNSGSCFGSVRSLGDRDQHALAPS